jgi:hypothetical protein
MRTISVPESLKSMSEWGECLTAHNGSCATGTTGLLCINIPKNAVQKQ